MDMSDIRSLISFSKYFYVTKMFEKTFIVYWGCPSVDTRISDGFRYYPHHPHLFCWDNWNL